MLRLTPKNTTLTGKITKSYVKTIKMLLSRFFDLHPENEWTAHYLVWWLSDEVRPEITSATWRNYKAAIVRYLASEDADDAARDLVDVDSSQCRSKAKRKCDRNTSGQRPKTVNQVAKKQVLKYLRSKNRQWDPLLALWIEVGIQTELRPDEWRNAKMFKLKVKNGKYKQTP